jgi:dipeptidase E
MRRLLLASSSNVHGSGYLDHCEEAMRELLGSGVRRVLFVPFALADHAAYAAKARERLALMGYGVDSLHEASDPRAAAAAAQAFFVGGGNTFRLIDALQRLGLIGAIQARVTAGAPYIGTSAGSNAACPTLMTTNDMPIVQPASFAALDLVPFQINAHYQDPDPGSTHKGETREQRIAEFHEENTTPVIGLREGALLRVEGASMHLAGLRGARLFRRGRTPEGFEPGADLSFLLGAP